MLLVRSGHVISVAAGYCSPRQGRRRGPVIGEMRDTTGPRNETCLRVPAGTRAGADLVTLSSDTGSATPPARRRVSVRLGMEQHRDFSADDARRIGEQIGIDWDSSLFDVEQFGMGLKVELEHGRRDPATNVSDDDERTTGKIARAHLNEFPDYYTRLAQMEADAERYWSERERGLSE